MKVLLVGSAGQLGTVLMPILTAEGHVVSGVDRGDIDIADAQSTHNVIAEFQPDWVINAAAYTAVDKAEEEFDLAYLVNCDGAKNVAKAASEVGARAVHISTDYVFDGTATNPYVEVDVTNPTSVYGQSKLAGEQAVMEAHPNAYIVRTAWLYAGRSQTNFRAAILRLAQQGSPLRVVDDQIGQPTSCTELAHGIVSLIATSPSPGIYHATCDGQTSWFGFAREILNQVGMSDMPITPVPTSEFPRPAPRPAFSVLSHAKWNAAGLRPLAHWVDALQNETQLAATDV